MGKVVEMKATTQVQDTVKTEVVNKDKPMHQKEVYDLVIASLRKVGNKHYASIPLTLLFADKRFQRNSKSANAKIKRLVDRWNPNKMDALKVVPHGETCNFSVVDGFHRLTALKMMGVTTVECEVVLGLSENPDERLVQEAFLFATQGDEVDHLLPVDKHNANLVIGVKENVAVDTLCQKYHIPLKTSLRGRTKLSHLAGFTAALNIARINETLLDDVFYILCESRWNLAAKGLGALTLKTVSGILSLHPEDKENVIKALIEYFTPIDPSQYYANAYIKYPERREQERLVLFLEDYLVENLGITRVYNGGTVHIAKETVAA